MNKLTRAMNSDALPWHQQRMAVTELMSLKGQVAAVTAGGGPNLGSAICNRLAGLGATLAVIDIDYDAAAATAEAISQQWNTKAVPYQGDVADARSVRQFVSKIADDLDRIDIWVNNVGLASLPGKPANRFDELSFEEIDWFVGVDLKGALYCSRAVLDYMLPKKRGRIINIASESGKSWAVKRTVYSTCKAGVIGFTRSLSHELAGSGVSVVAVCPGIMLGRKSLDRLEALDDASADPAFEVLSNAISKVSAGRASIPEEVANLVAFLATEAGSYIQGTALSAGGGMAD